MAAVDIPVSRLSAYLSVPEESITPLAEFTDFLAAVLAKANEHEEMKADKLRVDVELEQAVRTADNRVASMKAQLDRALQETQELRVKVSSTETARSALENELINYKSSRTTIDEEVRNLRTDKLVLQNEKTQLVDTLNRKSNDYDKLQEEITAQQARLIEQRKEISSLGSQLQQAQSAQTGAKFREQQLEQELTLCRDSSEFSRNELQLKISEYQKFRKEKSAQISKLQNELEEAVSEADMAKGSLDNLRSRYEEVAKAAEDRLMEIQQLNQKHATQEEAFKNEIGTFKQLAELQESAATTHKRRVKEVEHRAEQEVNMANQEAGRMKAQWQREHEERVAAENKIAELENTIERLEKDADASVAGSFAAGSPPEFNAPSPTGSGIMSPTRRPGSPSSFSAMTPRTAADRVQKGGYSVTQMYSDLSKTKALYQTEKRRNIKLQAAVDELAADLDRVGPETAEIREENENLRKEMEELGNLLNGVAKERDDANKNAKKLQQSLADVQNQLGAQNTHLRDLSRQIQVLTAEIEMRTSGDTEMSGPQAKLYEQIISGQVVLEDESSTDQIISRRLVVFRNVKELQEQNAQLLMAARELSQRLENDQDAQKAEANEEAQRVIADLQAKLERAHAEINTMSSRLHSYVNERDILRRQVSERHVHPRIQNNATPPESQDISTALVQQSQETLSKAFEDLSAQYDAYRQETSINHSTLEQQLREVGNERTQLQLEVAKISSQMNLGKDRFDMLKRDLESSQSEGEKLRQRVSTMHEQAARLDLHNQQISEELHDVKSMLETMRTESSNLKAEKNLWKSIEKRLSEDNEMLTQERTRLNKLVSDLQSIQTERDRDESESRRRLQNQVDRLEHELQNTSRRLNQEMEENKNLLQRKDLALSDKQQQLDKINADWTKSREELIEAKTSRDFLQRRVDELTVDLKAVESKLAAYQNKPTSANATTMDVDEDDDLTSEQQLQMEVAELKKQLEYAKADFERATEESEKYKELASDMEARLNEISETYDGYKEDLENQLHEAQAKVVDLEKRVEEATSELNTVSQELSEIRGANSDSRRQFEAEKELLQSEIAKLKDDNDKALASTSFFQEDLRRQAAIATEAQGNYEAELVKHGQATAQLQEIRRKYAELKSSVHAMKSEAESARAALSSSEGSWESQKENYEKEMSEMRTRYAELNRQNKILLGQFEAVSEQVSSLKQSRAANDEAMETDSDNKTDQLREIIQYLRQEKDIVDVQFNIAKTESERFKSQLEHAKSQLDEVRVQLSQERQKDSEQLTSAKQKELMDKINELNLLRESNQALRSDNERNSKKAREYFAKAQELEAKIAPLEEQIGALQAEIEVRDGTMEQLKRDNEYWRDRTQKILQKYDRVDPEEMEQLKNQLTTLQTTINELTVEKNSLTETAANFDQQKQQAVSETRELWQGKIEKLKNNANKTVAGIKNQSAEVTKERDDLKAQYEQLQSEKAAVEEELAGVTAELQGINAGSAQQFEELQNLRAQYNELTTQIEAFRAKEAELTNELTVAQSQGAIDPAAVEAEVQKRVAQMESTLDPEAVEEEVQRRLEELKPAAIEAEVQRRIAGLPVPTPVAAPVDNTEAIEAAVQQRLAEMKSQPKEESLEAGEVEEKPEGENMEAVVEARVQERVTAAFAAEKEALEKKSKLTEERLAKAREGFQNYKKKAVDEAVADVEKRYQEELRKAKEEEAQKTSNLEAEITQLRGEIETLKAQLAEAEKRAGSVPTVNDEEYKARIAELETKLKEVAEKPAEKPAEDYGPGATDLEALREEIKFEVQAEMMAGTKDEKLKGTIKKNVDHRFGMLISRHKEAWQKEADEQREKLIEERLQTALKEKIEEKEKELEQKYKDQAEGQEKEQAEQLVRSQDALRQEGRARAMVQINMKEKLVQQLQERVKGLEGEVRRLAGSADVATPTPTPAVTTTTAPTPAPAQTPAPQAQPPQQQQQQIRRPSAAPAETPHPASSIPAPASRRSDLGTGPAVLRGMMRGAMGSSIPRGGAMINGRGAPPPQQQQSGIPAINPFMANTSATGAFTQQLPVAANPFQAPGQQGQGRGRGGQRGRGRGGGQLQNVQTGLPMMPGQQQHVQQSPGGRINPAARQFVPGPKRVREEGEGEAESEAGRGGKKSRGQ